MWINPLVASIFLCLASALMLRLRSMASGRLSTMGDSQTTTPIGRGIDAAIAMAHAHVKAGGSLTDLYGSEDVEKRAHEPTGLSALSLGGIVRNLERHADQRDTPEELEQAANGIFFGWEDQSKSWQLNDQLFADDCCRLSTSEDHGQSQGECLCSSPSNDQASICASPVDAGSFLYVRGTPTSLSPW